MAKFVENAEEVPTPFVLGSQLAEFKTVIGKYIAPKL